MEGATVHSLWRQLYINLQESSLAQFLQHQTRGNNALALVFDTKEYLVENIGALDKFSNSDHRAITFTTNPLS